eukprot:SAG22_NODE_459_length_10228_cov_9.593642_7_plen_976_part_00
MLTSPGNAVAGVASALHVNIYLLALALILQTPYLPVMDCMQMATVGTICLQVTASFFSPYKGFAIANCDTVPGAVMVGIIASIAESVEDVHDADQAEMQYVYDTLEASFDNTTSNVTQSFLHRPAVTECYEDETCTTRARSTIIVGIMFCNFIVAALLFGMGSGHAARVIAFVPTTVQSAFLAAVGWKILKTGVTFMVTRQEMKEIATGQFDDSSGGIVLNLVIVLVLGVGINIIEVKGHHSRVSKWLWPIMLVALTAIFYLVLVAYGPASGKTFEQAFQDAQYPNMTGSAFPTLPRGMGWLLASEQAEEMWFPQYHNFDFSLVKWSAIFSTGQAMNYVLLLVISILSILLNSVAIEEETGTDVDLNVDLKTTALGNLIAAPFAGFIGFASAHKTLLCHGMGGENFAGMWAAAYFFWFWAIGHLMARYIPVPVIGGFIAAIGMELLVEWIWHMRHKLAKSEMKELLLLFLLMTFSFIGGFLLGMLLSMLAFTARYIQTPVIKSALDGTEYQGKALRDWRGKTMLLRYGTQILTLRLQGFVFFFTAEKLRLSTMTLLERKKAKERAVKFLVMDFHMVDNVDATAVKKIKKILKFCETEGITMILTSLNHDMEHAFHHDEVTEEQFSNLRIMGDVDLGVEWASDQIIADPVRKFDFIKRWSGQMAQWNGVGPKRKMTLQTVTDRFTMLGVSRGILTYMRVGFGKFVQGENFDSTTFRDGGTTRTYNKGDTIAAQQEFLRGDEKLYFIAAGSAIKVHDGMVGRKRIEKRYAGTVIGEMSFFLKTPRHDSIIADEDNTVMVEFTEKQYDILRHKYPLLGEELLKHVLTKLGDTIKRLVNENHMLHILDGEESDEEFEESQQGIDSELAARKKPKTSNDRILGGKDSNAKMTPSASADAASRETDFEAGPGEDIEVRHHTGFGLINHDENIFEEDKLALSGSKCHKCGNEFVGDAQFCRKCGAKRKDAPPGSPKAPLSSE